MSYCKLLLMIALCIDAKIVISGNKNTTSSVIAQLLDNTGTDSESIRTTLIDSGLFDTVNVKQDNNDTYIEVIENDFVGEIKYDLNFKLPAELKMENITGLKANSIISRSKIENAINRFKFALEQQMGKIVDVSYVRHDNGNVTIYGNEKYSIGMTEIEFKGLKKMNASSIFSHLPMYSQFMGNKVPQAYIQYYRQIIENYGHSLGLKDCKVDKVNFIPEDNLGNVRVIITVNEGEQYYVENCLLNSKDISEEANDALRKMVDDYMLKNQAKRLIDMEKFINDMMSLLNSYYDYLEIKYEVNKTTDYGMELVLNVVPSSMCVDHIEISGNRITDSSLIMDILELYPGKRFSQAALNQARMNAVLLPFIRDVTIEKEKIAGDMYVLRVLVKEKSTLNFSGNPLSFHRDESITRDDNIEGWGPIALCKNFFKTWSFEANGGAQWSNLFGTGRALNINGSAHNLSRIMEWKSLGCAVSYSTPAALRKSRIGDVWFVAYGRSNARFTGSDFRKRPEELKDKKRLYSIIGMKRWNFAYHISIKGRSIDFHTGVEGTAVHYRDFRIVHNGKNYWTNLPDDKKDNENQCYTEDPTKVSECLRDLLRVNKLLPKTDQWMYKVKFNVGSSWIKKFKLSYLRVTPSFDISMYSAKVGLFAQFGMYHVIPGLHLVFSSQVQGMSVISEKYNKWLLERVYGKFEDYETIVNQMSNDDYIQSESSLYHMEVSPYNQLTDMHAGGKYKVGFIAYGEYDLDNSDMFRFMSEFAKPFFGFQCISVWGHDKDFVINYGVGNPEWNELNRWEHYFNNSKSDELIVDKKFRLRMAVSFGVTVVLPLVGPFKIGLNISIPILFEIAGCKFGNDKNFDNVSFLIFERGVWSD